MKMLRSLSVSRVSPTGVSLVVLIGLLAGYAVVQPSAMSVSSLTAVAGQNAVVAIAAVGAGLIVITGGFDLSVGATMSLVDVVIATHVGTGTGSEYAAIAVGLGVGIGVGIGNAILVAWLRLESIVATLAMSFLVGGLALLGLSEPGGVVSPGLVALVDGATGVMPNATILLAVVAVGVILLRRTKSGLRIYAQGGNPTAVVTNGVEPRVVLSIAYIGAGALYGLAGVVLAGQAASGDPNIGAPLLLPVFAAIAVGGTPFGGGRGNLVGCIIGAFVLGVAANVLYALGVASYWSTIFNGMVLVLAVGANRAEILIRVMRRLKYELSTNRPQVSAG